MCIRDRHTIELQLSDKVKARIIDEEQTNEYVSLDNEYDQSSQHKVYEYLYETDAARVMHN